MPQNLGRFGAHGESEDVGGSDADRDPIFDLGHARREPGGALGLPPLGPRPYALPLRITSPYVRFDGDVFSVDLRVAAKRLLDLGLDLGRRDLRFKSYEVGDALDAPGASGGLFGARALIVPFGRTFERDPTVLDHDFHILGRVGSSFLRALTASRAISGVWAFTAGGQTDFDVVCGFSATPATRLASFSACHF